MRSLTLVAVCASLLGASSLPIASPQEAARSDKFVLEAGDHAITDLIDRSASYLGRNYLYSEADLLNASNGKVKLQQRLELDASGCESVVSQIAYTMGFAMIPIDEQRGLYEWVYRQGPKRAELAVRAKSMDPDEVLRNRHLKITVLTSIPLNHVNATAAQNQLRPFFMVGGTSGVGQMQFGAAGQSLLVQGYADQVAAAIELVRKADAPPPGPSTESPEREWRDDVEQRLQSLEERVGK